MAEPQKFQTVKSLIEHLALETVSFSADQRPVGHTYGAMLAIIQKRFKRIEYPGPHLGKPLRLSIRQMRNVCYDLQANRRELKFPSRPRAKRMGDDHEPAKIPSPSLQPTAGRQRERA
jgi:hypothetical protein